MTESHFDMAVLPDIMGLHAPDEQLEFLQFFLEHMEASLAAPPFIGDSLDLPECEGKAHMLKSSCRSVGAMRLGGVLEQLEHAASVGDDERCVVLCKELQAVFAETLVHIQTRMLQLRALQS